jgi:hypothetical protein
MVSCAVVVVLFSLIAQKKDSEDRGSCTNSGNFLFVILWFSLDIDSNFIGKKGT